MFCPSCGNESNSKSNACNSCGARIASNNLPEEQNRIVRPLNLRMIGGVCSGIAIHYGWEIATVRMAVATAACVTTGLPVILYLAAWMYLPNSTFALPPATRYVAVGFGDDSAV